MVSKTQKAMYKKRAKLSLCKGKSVKAPNKCKKVKGCKVASGTKRAYCRKANATRYAKRK